MDQNLSIKTHKHDILSIVRNIYIIMFPETSAICMIFATVKNNTVKFELKRSKNIEGVFKIE